MQFEEIHPLAINSFENSNFVGVSEHKIVCDPEGDGIYSFGGHSWPTENCRNKIWKFNMATRTWTQLRSDGLPMILADHCVVNLGRTANGPSRLVIFGGHLPNGAISNTIHLYDVHNERWEKVVTTGPSLGESDVVAMANYRAYMYVATGRLDIGCVEIRRFKLQTFVWEEVVVGESGAPEYGDSHEIVIYDDKVYMFMDYLCWRYQLLNIPFFDTKADRWGKLRTLPDPCQGYPQARNNFRCVKYEGNVYIVGGSAQETWYEDESTPLSDLWRVDLKTGQWCKLPISLPRPLWSQSVDVDRDGVLYVFGGCTKDGYDPTNQLWRAPLVVQPLKRLAWNKIVSCVSHEMISNDKMLDTLSLSLPPGFVLSKFKW